MKFYHFFALATVCALSLAGCSNNDISYDDEFEQGPLDWAVMENILEGQESVMYKRTSSSWYRWSYANNDGWEKQDYSQWVGASVPAPLSIVMHNGCAWQPLTMETCAGGPSVLSGPFYAYCRVTGFNKEFYALASMDLDFANATFKLNNANYKVMSVTKDNLKLKYICDFAGGEGGKGGKNKYYITFKCVSLSEADINNILFYDSELEAKLAMVEMIRAQFGNEFNLNDYFDGQVILSYPMVNLNDIEAGLKAGTLY